MFKRIISLFCIVLPLNMLAQGTFTVTVYNTSNSGLPSDTVLNVVTKNGIIWALTIRGLARFDGSNWTVYDTSNSGILFDAYRISVNDTNTVFIGGNFSGLTVFDGVTWTTYNTSNSGIPSNAVSNALITDRFNNVWGTAGSSIFKFDGNSWTIYNSSNSTLPSSSVRDIAIDIFDFIWVGTSGSGLRKFDGNAWIAIVPTLSPSNVRFHQIATDVFGNPWSFVEDFGDPFGIYVFDGSIWMHYHTGNSGLTQNYCNDFVIDNANIKWMAVASGLLKFDGSIWQVYNHSNGIGNKELEAIAIDEAGNKWIATKGFGLVKFSDGGAGPIEYPYFISGTIQTESGIPVPGVKVMLTGSKTDSVTTTSNGQYSFTVQKGGNYTITPAKNNDFITNNGITSIDVLKIRRHILGVPLGSPYKIIAADVDGSNSVTAQDVLHIRSMILQNISVFPNGELWSFLPSDHVFTNSQNPFPFPTSVTFNNLQQDMSNQNFIGIKLGDVNESWDAGIP